MPPVRALGVRQSILPAQQREQLYELFEKYRTWLQDARLYDLNLLAQDSLALAAPRYDFVMVDEVQDLTTAQLALVLKTLKEPDRFVLCGDSNQIVDPNFSPGARSRRSSGAIRSWRNGSSCVS
jgi:superfamily I DNA/RNA helicase